MNWIQLQNIDQLDAIEKLSFEKPVAIFKHSTRCGVSSMVLKNLNRELDSINRDDVAFYFLDLIQFRDISNQVAQRWNIEHQSPQIIILENGLVKNHASHYQIDASLVAEN